MWQWCQLIPLGKVQSTELHSLFPLKIMTCGKSVPTVYDLYYPLDYLSQFKQSMSILFAVLKKSHVQDISETSVDTCILFSRGSLEMQTLGQQVELRHHPLVLWLIFGNHVKFFFLSLRMTHIKSTTPNSLRSNKQRRGNIFFVWQDFKYASLMRDGSFFRVVWGQSFILRCDQSYLCNIRSQSHPGKQFPPESKNIRRGNFANFDLHTLNCM